MDRRALDIEEIFFAAGELRSPEARAAYLDEVCGPDADLRRRVERLLAAGQRVGGDFLDAPAAGPTVSLGGGAGPEGAGAVIGPYRLMEQIGEGGMGVVYVAEQSHPIRRKVALKVIKPGMDTRQVIARFEAERQALAMMDHPNIARVLDAGTTDSGRPYFVMELVRGRPITEYCDLEKLPIEERLELFVLVCRAVQHAHQKGIIHRDLKPSNVLVTLHDGVPVPKVIDFGVAKATGQALTDKTVYTAFAQLIGTPLYMSPEQVELSGLDVDTRSDIYSLGVLLYELLTGTTPFDGETLRSAAFDEMRRIIREEEPPRPSTRLSSLGETLTGVSARRGSDPRRLDRAVRGELDWIAMKALEKDRRRRYETANDLADDVMRHLTDRPVEACPPSASYLLAKLARRHRTAFTAGGLVALALVAGLAASAWQAVRATAAERRAEDHLALAREAVDDLYEQVADRWMNDVRWGPLPRAFLEKTLPFYRRFAESRRVDLEVGRAHRRVGEILAQLDRGAEAELSFKKAEAVFRALQAVDPDNPDPTRELAACYAARAIMGGSAPPHREAIALYEGLVARFPGEVRYQRELAIILANLGNRLWWTKQPGAEEYLDRARAMQERLCSARPGDPELRSDLGATLCNLGNRARDTGRLDEAERYQRRALGIHDGLVTRHPTRPQFWLQLGWDHFELGRTLVAAQKYEEIPEVSGRAATIFEGLANDYPDVIWFRRFWAQAFADVAKARFQTGHPAEAEEAIRRMLAIGDDAYAAEQLLWIAGDLGYSNIPKFSHPALSLKLLERSAKLRRDDSGFTDHARGGALFRLGEDDAAIRELERARTLMAEDGSMHLGTGFFLAMAYHRKGDVAKARDWFDRSVAWMERHEPKDRFLVQFRAEAVALLGVRPPREGP